MSGEGSDDEGDGGFRVLGVVTRAGDDVASPGPVQQTDRRITKQGQDAGSLAEMNQAGVFAEAHVLAPA